MKFLRMKYIPFEVSFFTLCFHKIFFQKMVQVGDRDLVVKDGFVPQIPNPALILVGLVSKFLELVHHLKTRCSIIPLYSSITMAKLIFYTRAYTFIRDSNSWSPTRNTGRFHQIGSKIIFYFVCTDVTRNNSRII